MIATVKSQDLGFHKKCKRVFINHGTVVSANMEPLDKVVHLYDFDAQEIVIEKNDNGDRYIVETHKGAVIDIVNKDITRMFKDFEKVDVIAQDGRIVIKGRHAESKIKEREETLRRRLETSQPIRKGGLFAGLGLLCRETTKGLKKAGVRVEQRFANEYNPLAAEVNIAGNSVWENAADDAMFVMDDIYTMNKSLIPKLDMMIIGSPCPAFSAANTTMKRDGKTDIFHPESGTIFAPIVEAIQIANPALVLLENSKFFSGSIFDYCMSDLMERLGYKSTETVVTGQEFGDFEKRERLCRVWYSKGLPAPELNNLPFKQQNQRTLGEMIEPMDLDDKRWARRKYLEAKDAQAHNGHKYCITGLDATKLPTFSANYAKIQADSTLIEHPEKPLVTRILTESEHANVRDIDDLLKENIVAIARGTHYAQKTNRGSVTEAHKMLGNSISPKPWFSVAYRLGEWMKSMIRKECVKTAGQIKMAL